MKSPRTKHLALFIFLLSLFFQQSVLSQNLLRIRENGLWGYIDYSGRKVITPKFNSEGDFSEGLAPVRLGGYYGYIDTNAHFVIQPQYDYADEFHSGIAVVGFNGSYNYITIDNRKLLETPNRYANLPQFNNGVAFVSTYNPSTGDRKYGLIDKNGNLILDTIFQRITNFNNGVAVVKTWHDYADTLLKAQYGVIDTLGNLLVPFDKYARIEDFVDGFAFVIMAGNKNGIIDTKGHLVIEINDSIKICRTCGMHDGLICIYTTLKDKKDSVMGMINMKGELVLTFPEYSYIGPFSHGRAFARLKSNGKYVLIDRFGKKSGGTEFSASVLNPVFNNGYCQNQINGMLTVIDTNGIFHIMPQFHYISYNIAENGNFLFEQYFTDSYGHNSLHWGMANLKGEIIIPARFRWHDFNWPKCILIPVIDNNEAMYIDTMGKTIWAEDKHDYTNPLRLDIDYMLNNGYLGYSLKEKEKYLNPKGVYPEKILQSQNFRDDSVEVKIDETETAVYLKKYAAMNLYIVNNTKQTAIFPALENWLFIKMQALDSNGMWTDIEDWERHFMMDCYEFSASLDAGYYWKFVIPKFEGAAKTKLRVKVLIKGNGNLDGTLYSNVIDGNINPGQFWRLKPNLRMNIFDFTE